ncbi:uncharacterized protein LOC120329496 [Styela clava]
MDKEAQPGNNLWSENVDELPSPAVEFLNPFDGNIPPDENAAGVPPFLLGPPLFEGPPLLEEDTGGRVLFQPQITTSTIAPTSARQLTFNVTSNVTADSDFNVTPKYESDIESYRNITTESTMQNVSTQATVDDGIRSLTTTEIIVICTVVPAVVILFVMGMALWYFIASKKRRSNRRVGVGNEHGQENADNNVEDRPPSSLSKTLHSNAPNTASPNGNGSINNAGLRQQAWAIETQTVAD